MFIAILWNTFLMKKWLNYYTILERTMSITGRWFYPGIRLGHLESSSNMKAVDRHMTSAVECDVKYKSTNQ